MSSTTNAPAVNTVSLPAAKGIFSELFSAKNLPTVILGVTIMAVAAFIERALDAVESGFTMEWVILTLVTLAVFGLVARVLVGATAAARASFVRSATKPVADTQTPARNLSKRLDGPSVIELRFW